MRGPWSIRFKSWSRLESFLRSKSFLRRTWSIRHKMIFVAGVLATIVGILAFTAFQGLYSYRELVRSISHRAAEIPQAGELVRHVDGMRFVLSQAATLGAWSEDTAFRTAVREAFRDHVREARQCCQEYQQVLESLEPSDNRFGDIAEIYGILRQVDACLQRVEELDSDPNWLLEQASHVERLRQAVNDLHEAVRLVPNNLYTRMRDLQSAVRGQYRTWIVVCWFATAAVLVLLTIMAFCFRSWVLVPLKTLIDGSRRVAAGDFAHRIRLETGDEMSELAKALNAMTDRFVQIRDDLNQQVRQRTKEVVRSEQLASVGFLAAGVAHEINNPIGAIALAADALEGRLAEWMSGVPESHRPRDYETIQRYLHMIQDEASRCKQITESLLDFSRLGHTERQPTDLASLTRHVVDMVQHLGKYRSKNIVCHLTPGIYCNGNPQELKQVVLNLLTNALDAVDDNGRVEVVVKEEQQTVVLQVTDNGCGMTEEVREHLFEPFFTRRRDGQGTGLGLSISYRIIQDHNGTITAHSDGPGCGSQFVVTLPKVHYETSKQGRLQAA